MVFPQSGDGIARHPSQLYQLGLEGLERTVFDCVSAGGAAGVAIDAVDDGSGLAASQVLATIAVLEMRRLVRRLPGSRVQRS